MSYWKLAITLRMRISNHAKKRVKERCGLPKKAVEKLAKKALLEGVSHKESSGRLEKYITYLFHYNQSANNIKIYHEKVFIFAGETLITVLHLPNEHKKAVNKILGRRRG